MRLASTLLLAACGGAGEAPEPRAGAPTPPPEQTPTPTPTRAEAPATAVDPAAEARCRAALQGRLVDNPKTSAQDLHEAGMACRELDRSADAVALLDAAVSRDPTHALAHLELARALGALRADSGPCEADATVARMLTHAAAAVQLDPTQRARLSADELSALAQVPRFRILRGADPATRKGVALTAQGATFHAAAAGAFGPPWTVTLTGQAPHKELEHGALPARFEDRAVGESGALEVRERVGGWAVDEAGAVLLDPDGGAPGPEVQRWRMTAEGDLVGPDGARLLGTPTECAG